jgi:hypothetical protein
MSDTNNNAPRYADDVIAEAEDTVARLSGLVPRERIVHVPDAMERWKADAEASDRAHEQGKRELRQREAAAADAAELAAVEAGVEHEAGWEEWLATRLAAERTALLEALADEFSDAVTKLREEFGEQISAVRKLVEAERAARRQDRTRALERLKGVRAANAEKVAALTAKVDAQQRAIGLLEIRLHKTKTEAARRAETEEAVAVMLRALYEELMLRR